MKLLIISLLLILGTIQLHSELSPFVVDKPITKKEWKKIHKQDEKLRELIDFEKLRAFIIQESKERKKVTIGSAGDTVTLDLGSNLPTEEWKLTFPRELIYTSGNWHWRYGDTIDAYYFERDVSIHWKISVKEKDDFKILEERIEDDRYTLY